MDDRETGDAGSAVAARDRSPELLAAVVLAGGAGRRLGGVDKPAIMVGGRPLLGSVVEAAVLAGAGRIVVVGPARPGFPVVSFTSEEPAGGGPVPALRAGLALVSEPVMLLLAGDLPFLDAGVLRGLAASARDGTGDGAVLVDDSGRAQWLASCWGTAGLRAALESYSGDSLRGLLSSLNYAELAPAPEAGAPPWWLDCDTPEDLAAARSLADPDRP